MLSAEKEQEFVHNLDVSIYGAQMGEELWR